MKKHLAALLATSLLTACSLAPEFMTPTIATPDAWKNAPTTTDADVQVSDAQWWQQFNSTELSALISKAAAENNDLLAAAARIEQAQANAVIAGAPLLPSLAVGGNASKTYRTAHGNTSSDGYQVGPALAYEVDLFGKLRDAAHAAQSTVTATAYDRDALRLSITAQVAQGYFNLLALQQRVAIAENNLRNARAVLAATQTRFDVGVLSRVELAQQKTLTANEEASLQTILQQREAATNALAVLLGATPESFAITATSLDGMRAPGVTPSLPAALIAHRPDIASIEAQMRAANFEIGAARAAFFPSLNLSAGTALAANPASAAAATITSLAAAISMPLFTNGALEGGFDNATARQKELAANYRKAVLTAFGEVENALRGIDTSGARLASLTTAAAEAQSAYDAATTRYNVGVIDYPTLLSTQTTLLQAQDALAQARADRLAASVDLFKALGGGWN